MAISTFCKRCGVHFEPPPQKPAKGGFLRSLFGGGKKEEVDEAAERHAPILTPAPGKPGLPVPAIRSSSEADPFDIPDGTENSAGSGLRVRKSVDLSDPYSDMIEVEAPSAPKTVFSERQRDPNDREIPCVDCGKTLYVSPRATSTQCGKCGAYCSMKDYDVRTHVRENIKTRGNITIHKKSSLTASRIVCTDLKVFGQISGKIDCAGDASFRSSGKVIGSMKCKNLTIARGCVLEFVPGIQADTAEIHGEVTGDVICEGTIRISKEGAVFGDCIAPAISLEEGAALSGQMRFMKPDKEMYEEYMRKANEAEEELFENEELPADSDSGEDEDATGGETPEAEQRDEESRSD